MYIGTYGTYPNHRCENNSRRLLINLIRHGRRVIFGREFEILIVAPIY